MSKHSKNEPPYDLGVLAYRAKTSISLNPYVQYDWQHEEWEKGWMSEFDLDYSSTFDWKSLDFG
ncbi:hypothetical protein KW882_00120 [Vibrio parahaemolyticus]